MVSPPTWPNTRVWHVLVSHALKVKKSYTTYSFSWLWAGFQLHHHTHRSLVVSPLVHVAFLRFFGGSFSDHFWAHFLHSVFEPSDHSIKPTQTIAWTPSRRSEVPFFWVRYSVWVTRHLLHSWLQRLLARCCGASAYRLERRSQSCSY